VKNLANKNFNTSVKLIKRQTIEINSKYKLFSYHINLSKNSSSYIHTSLMHTNYFSKYNNEYSYMTNNFKSNEVFNFEIVSGNSSVINSSRLKKSHNSNQSYIQTDLQRTSTTRFSKNTNTQIINQQNLDYKKQIKKMTCVNLALVLVIFLISLIFYYICSIENSELLKIVNLKLDFACFQYYFYYNTMFSMIFYFILNPGSNNQGGYYKNTQNYFKRFPGTNMTDFVSFTIAERTVLVEDGFLKLIDLKNKFYSNSIFTVFNSSKPSEKIIHKFVWNIETGSIMSLFNLL